MSEKRYRYFPVILDSSKPLYRETKIYVNARGGVDPATGIPFEARCLGMEPDGAGMYVVDMESMYAKEKLTVLSRCVEKGDPIIGPFDSREKAIIEQAKCRVLTIEEKLAQAEARAEAAEAELKKRPESISTLMAKQRQASGSVATEK